ncbi:MAG: hypothetical protein MUO97_09485 [Dehalococcoidia bacterium]|nr:hypothetical protein [Dehalococcoidia bacterium]
MTVIRNVTGLLADVPKEYAFRCHDGLILQSMKQLGSALNSMTDETYVFHANTKKNDFSNWVRDIIGDEKLAKDLEKVTDRTQAAKQASSRVGVLSRKLSK